MIFGNTAIFGLELDVKRFYISALEMGSGKFRIFIDGVAFGVDEPDATVLTCVRDDLIRRLSFKGRHITPFARMPAQEIASAIAVNIYSDQSPRDLGDCSEKDIRNFLVGNQLEWAPGGSSAFDDGSFVYQFDIGDHVRLIGFKIKEHGKAIEVRECIVPSEVYYKIISDVVEEFDLNREQWLAVQPKDAAQQES